MHPQIWSSADGGFIIQSYGFMIAVGFLSGLYLAMRRCIRVKCDADILVTIGLISLIVGTVGGRAFFVVHYWDEHFATAANPLRAVLDMRLGGFEFLGGLLPTIVAVLAYLRVKRVSIRLYADVIAIMIPWTLAFGRVGCFLNGCCYGGVCVDGEGRKASVFAVQFPFGSPASVKQWERRELTLPAELVRDGFADNVDSAITEAAPISRNVSFSAREIREMASQHPAVWTHPTQLYSAGAALFLSGFLARVFHRRRRHGMVFGLLLLMYPPIRFIMEIIRTDNPVDTFGMTISQAVSLCMIAAGVVWMIVIYKFMPERSPAATVHKRERRVYDALFPA